MTKKMKGRELTGGAKSVRGNGQRKVGRPVAICSSAMANESTMEWECAIRKLRGFPHVLRNPLIPDPNLIHVHEVLVTESLYLLPSC
jgi:hypothetical protein